MFSHRILPFAQLASKKASFGNKTGHMAYKGGINSRDKSMALIYLRELETLGRTLTGNNFE
jgi:hypothetical protein